MRIVAYVPCFRERDILPWVVSHLEEQGVQPHVIDNWSDDGTWEWLCAAGVECERFPPEGPPETYLWSRILQRIEVLAAESDADWCMRVDSDEIVRSPRGNLNLAEAIARVDAEGATVINSRVYNFRPISNDFQGDPEGHFKYCEKTSHYDGQFHENIWKNTGRVDIHTHGGHNVIRDGKVVHPERFILKHYPIRSQKQGERKIFQDRKPRWNPQERAAGWHCQYEGLQPGCSFLADPWDLVWYEDPKRPITDPVSVIIPAYNRDEGVFNQTLRAIGTVLCFSQIPTEIIVVDDDSPFKGEYPSCAKVVWRETNGGFGRAVEDGIAVASHRYIAQMNSDCELVEDTFAELIRAMQDHELDLVHPEHYEGCQAYKLNKTADLMGPDWRFGACWLTRRDVIDRLRAEDGFFFDPRFFLYHEDQDCFRRMDIKGLKRRGWRGSWIKHIGGGSGTPQAIAEEFAKSKRLYDEKWSSPAIIAAV